MIKRICTLLLLASTVHAAGQRYEQKDPKLNEEVQNIYKQIQFPQISTGTANKFTATDLRTSTVTISGEIIFKDGTIQTTAGTTVTVTDWASYTPTIAGVGTATGVSFFWRQVANAIEVKGFFTTGVCTAAPTTVTLPNSTIISSTKVSANFQLGVATRIVTSGVASTGVPWMVFYDGSDTAKAFITQQTKSNAFLKNNASDIFANGDSCAVFFDYPI